MINRIANHPPLNWNPEGRSKVLEKVWLSSPIGAYLGVLGAMHFPWKAARIASGVLAAGEIILCADLVRAQLKIWSQTK